MRARIVVATLAVVTITAIIGVMLILTIRVSIQRSAESELLRQATVTARLIQEDLGEIDVAAGRVSREEFRSYRAALGRSLDRARDLGGHDLVEASLRVDGRVLPIGLAPTVAVDSLTRNEVSIVPTSEGNLLVAVEEIEVDGAAVTVWIGRAEPLFPSGVVVWALLVALSAGAVLSIVLAGWFVRSLSRRLGSIGDAATAISAGDLTARAGDGGDDEIGRLAATFDAMADELQAARRREREFLMSVGHDLRTPLTTIRGYAEALDDGVVPAEDVDDVAAVLHRQTDLLSRLVEDVMLLARLESSEFTLRPEPVDVAALVAGIVEAYRARAVYAEVSLTFEPEGTVLVELDPDRFAQVATNLLDNALRYTPAGGSIVVALEALGDTIRIGVSNSGTVIAPDDLPHVFERLYVADRYRSVRPAGSGLGLAIVDDLVRAMGGTVTCVSDPRIGTRFEVTIASRIVAPT